MRAYYEASGASPAERRNVIPPFFNRVESGRYPKTVAAVCVQLYQYSEFNDDLLDNGNLERGALAADNDPVMRDCLPASVLSQAIAHSVV